MSRPPKVRHGWPWVWYQWRHSYVGRRWFWLQREAVFRWRFRSGQVVTHALFAHAIKRRSCLRAERWDFLLRRDPCTYCGARVAFARMTVEHVVPKSAGGYDRSSNKVGCCQRCNRERGNRHLLRFLLLRHDPLHGLLVTFAPKASNRKHPYGRPGAPLRTSIGAMLQHKRDPR